MNWGWLFFIIAMFYIIMHLRAVSRKVGFWAQIGNDWTSFVEAVKSLKKKTP